MKGHSLEWTAKCELFDGVSIDEAPEFLYCLGAAIHKYSRNTSIAIAGEPFSGLGIITSGSAVVTKESASGDRLIMAVLGPGMLFGEIVAFSEAPVWPATVMAQEACEVIFLAAGRIVGQCEKQCPFHRQLIRNMLRILSDKALLLNRKVEYLSLPSVRAKVASYLMEHYRKAGTRVLMLPLDRNELADFLNVARPALSREMGRMRDEGIIDYHRSSVKIVDLEALKRE